MILIILFMGMILFVMSLLVKWKETLDIREAGLEKYADDLTGWDTKQKCRRIGLVNFLGMAEKIAKEDPHLFKILEAFKDAEDWYVIPKDEYMEVPKNE